MDYLFLFIGCFLIALVFSAPFLQHQFEQKQRRNLRRRLSKVGRQGLTNEEYQKATEFKIIRGRHV